MKELEMKELLLNDYWMNFCVPLWILGVMPFVASVAWSLEGLQ